MGGTSEAAWSGGASPGRRGRRRVGAPASGAAGPAPCPAPVPPRGTSRSLSSGVCTGSSVVPWTPDSPSCLCVCGSLGCPSSSPPAKECHVQESLQVAAAGTAFPECVLFARVAPSPRTCAPSLRPHQAWVVRAAGTCAGWLGLGRGRREAPAPTDVFETLTPSAPRLTLLSPMGCAGQGRASRGAGACW